MSEASQLLLLTKYKWQQGGRGDEGSEIDADCLFAHNWLKSTSSGSALFPSAQQNDTQHVRLSMREEEDGGETDTQDRQRESLFGGVRACVSERVHVQMRAQHRTS